VFNVPISGRLVVQLNKGETIKSATLDNKAMLVEEDSGGRYFIHLPKNLPRSAFVIKLQVAGGEQNIADAAKI
jgi:hypothetical protein